MRLPADKIEEIRNTIDIVDIIASYVTLKKRGKNFVGLCPFHTEKTPSFYVSPERQMYHCFGCGVGGNVFTFLMETEKISFIEAVKSLAERVGIQLPSYSSESDIETRDREELLQAVRFAAVYYYKNLYETEEGKNALDYLRKRGFNNETIKIFGIGYAMNSWDAFYRYAMEQKIPEYILEKAGLIKKHEDGTCYDTFRGRIIFPILSASGRVLGFGARKFFEEDQLGKYINSPDTPIYNKSRVLYGLYYAKDTIREKDLAILVEGYADLIKTYQAGFKNVVASSGTALTNEQIKLLSRYTKNIIILYDADSAGSKATLRGIDLILENDMDVQVAALPHGEDPDSYIEKYGVQKFENLLINSVSFIDFMIRTLEAESSFDTPAGKTKVVRNIIGTLSKVGDPIKRNFYIKHVANKYGIYESLIYNEMDKYLGKDNKKKYSQPESIKQEDGRIFLDSIQKETVDVPLVEKDLLHAMLDGRNTVVEFVFNHFQPERFSHFYSSYIAKCIKQLYDNNVHIEASSVYDYILNDEITEKDQILKFLTNLIFSKYEISKRWPEFGQEIAQGDALKIAKDTLRKIIKSEVQKQLERNQFLMKEAEKRGEELERYIHIHSSLIEKLRNVDNKNFFSED